MNLMFIIILKYISLVLFVFVLSAWVVPLIAILLLQLFADRLARLDEFVHQHFVVLVVIQVVLSVLHVCQQLLNVLVLRYVGELKPLLEQLLCVHSKLLKTGRVFLLQFLVNLQS